MNESSLKSFIINKIAENKNKYKVLELLDSDRIPIAAIYLDKLKANIEDVTICQTSTKEKYYLYINGIAVFFTYYRFL